MEITFWLLLLGISYTYFGYPLLMALFLKIKKSKTINKAEIFPMVSIVIAAYNEEKNIGAKLNDILSLEYPNDKMEITVVSDSSSDGTDEIIRNFADRGVSLVRMERRSGKIAAYNKVIPETKGDILVFSDATSLLDKDSLKNLVSNFNDATVGCAGGLLMYINPKNAIVGKGEKKYWSYEKKIREYESALDSLPSVSGTLYAVRKNLYPLSMKNELADDLIIPITVRKLGYKTVFEKSAVCKDYTTISLAEEMTKRVRITLQNIRGLIDQLGILNPLRYGLFSWLVFSHKVCRLFVPLFLLLLLAVTFVLALNSVIFAVLFLCQIILIQSLSLA
jgi:cellulose synthase/poly-beta-1,6-N-acetylglucosamine synthase-like glycosyltransferase